MAAFRGCIVSALLLCCAAYCCAQEVAVKTDKTAYASSEKIAITLTNGLKEPIFSSAASRTPEFAISNCERKKSQWSWDAYRLRCPWPECDKGTEKPGQIKAGKSVSFTWKPRVYTGKEYKGLEPGLYRLTLIYQIPKATARDQWLWNTVKSNEFTIQ